jgi:hypothetical protein
MVRAPQVDRCRRLTIAEKAWEGIEGILKCYEERISPVRWFGKLFRGREGCYVICRMAFLLWVLRVVFTVPVSFGWCTSLLKIASAFVRLDILLVNTAVAIVTYSRANLP